MVLQDDDQVEGFCPHFSSVLSRDAILNDREKRSDLVRVPNPSVYSSLGREQFHMIICLKGMLNRNERIIEFVGAQKIERIEQK